MAFKLFTKKKGAKKTGTKYGKGGPLQNKLADHIRKKKFGK